MLETKKFLRAAKMVDIRFYCAVAHVLGGKTPKDEPVDNVVF